MKINSLGRQTDFIFAGFSGAIIYKENYVLVQTPSNPGFHWGNYMVFDRAPKLGDLKEWKALFDKEFPYLSEDHHYVFTWDTALDEKGQYQEFIDEGFELDSGVVLTATQLNTPKYWNHEISIKKVNSEADWEKAIQLQILCADPKYFGEGYEIFKRKQMAQYKKMSESGKGHWFGAFIEGRLVGDLGVFFENGIGRYQSVGTHPDFRNQGICATLVYSAGIATMEEIDVKTLVMEADPDYHAARIYESVGFKRSEVNHALSWWKK